MSSFANFIIVLLSFGTLVVDVALVLFVVWLAMWFVWWQVNDRPIADVRKEEPFRPLVRWISANALALGLIVSVAAVLGSLFFSNVIGYQPCELCWWLRIFIYPQVLIFGLAMIYERRGKPLGPIFSISGILSILALIVSVYQYYGVTFNASILGGCTATGVSCAKTYFVQFGYVTIPMMAVTSAALLLAIVVARRYK